MEAGWEHRASMTVDLVPTEVESKKNKSCGWRLEADELSPEFSGMVQFILAFAEAEVWEVGGSSVKKGEACVAPSILPRA